jgi:7-cyano-7-deazaguanine reductase
MSTTNLSDIASKSLGSSASYAVYTEQFDPSLLNPMPRSLARDQWNIKASDFVGYDTWHCHEATFLLDNGVPVAGTLKIVYSSGSHFMVESKSAKLYLNSFDMCKMGSTFDIAVANYEQQAVRDLEAALHTPVRVKFFPSGSDLLPDVALFPCEGYTDLNEVSKASDLVITDYEGKEEHLKFYSLKNTDQIVNEKFFTNALRSRCRHTKQKDTGAAYIHIITKGCEVIPETLFKQIVSLREVNEFHEFCAEKLFTSIKSHPAVIDCAVTLLYSRRGSLDINPTRASSYELLPPVLIDPNFYTKKAMGQ